jgi:hypothetical protein
MSRQCRRTLGPARRRSDRAVAPLDDLPGLERRVELVTNRWPPSAWEAVGEYLGHMANAPRASADRAAAVLKISRTRGTRSSPSATPSAARARAMTGSLATRQRRYRRANIASWAYPSWGSPV